jgi:3-hydroxyisobutyrate dehydrogenase-like beta-hydroxyacid dehydrogenase
LGLEDTGRLAVWAAIVAGSIALVDVELMHKDIRLALETADELHVPVPSAHAADEVLTWAGELGYSHRDIAALREVLAILAKEPESALPQ